jgi:hypothetical protein
MALQATNPKKKMNMKLERDRTVKYLQFFHLNLMNQTIKNNHMQNK